MCSVTVGRGTACQHASQLGVAERDLASLRAKVSAASKREAQLQVVPLLGGCARGWARRPAWPMPPAGAHTPDAGAQRLEGAPALGGCGGLLGVAPAACLPRTIYSALQLLGSGWVARERRRLRRGPRAAPGALRCSSTGCAPLHTRCRRAHRAGTRSQQRTATNESFILHRSHPNSTGVTRENRQIAALIEALAHRGTARGPVCDGSKRCTVAARSARARAPPQEGLWRHRGSPWGSRSRSRGRAVPRCLNRWR